MVKVRVDVIPKEGVLDPQGKAIGHALENLGFKGFGDVRAGKVIMLNINEKSPEKAEAVARTMAEKLLANLVIEDYRVSLL